MLYELFNKYKQKQTLSIVLIYLLILFLLSLYRTNLIVINVLLLVTGAGIFYNNIHLGMVFLFLWFVGSMLNRPQSEPETFKDLTLDQIKKTSLYNKLSNSGLSDDFILKNWNKFNDDVKEDTKTSNKTLELKNKNLNMVLTELLDDNQKIHINKNDTLKKNKINFVEDLVYNSSSDYLNNIPKIVTFIYLYKVYLFSVGKCLQLINRNKILVKKISKDAKSYFESQKIFLEAFYKDDVELLSLKEKLGLEYYLAKKDLITDNKKKNPYHILELLDLTEDFKQGNLKENLEKKLDESNNKYPVYTYKPRKDTYKETIEKLYKELKEQKTSTDDKGLKIKKLLESKLNKNYRMIKEYYELMVLFHHYDYFNLDEFTILEPYQTLRKINDNGNVVPLFVKYDISERASVSYLNYLKYNTGKTDIIDFSKIDDKKGKYDKDLDKQYDSLLKGEYKKIEGLYDYQKKTKDIDEIKKINFTEIGRGLTKTSVDIINEIVELFSKKQESFVDSKDGDVNDDLMSYSNFFTKYIHYFKEIVKILTKKGRMFDVGVLLLMVSVLMVFIEASK